MRDIEDIGSAWLPLASTMMRRGIEAADVLRADDHAVGNAQVAHRVRDFDVVHHAAADEGDFAVDARGDVDDLLNAVDAAGEAGENDAARGGTAEIFEARDDGTFGGSEAGALDVGGIGKRARTPSLP